MNMLTTSTKEDKDYEALKTQIKTRLNFNCEYYKDSHFKRRIDVRLRATKSKSYKEYLVVLKNDKEEYPILLDTLTVNVTNFFRNSEVYDVIEKAVFPTLLRAKNETILKNVKIWSAGCSIGVEAYSIAMLLHHILGKDVKSYNISITGTDIDKASLLKAQRGVYTETEMKDVKPIFLKKYFVKEGNEYHVIDELKKLTRFKSHDMISDPKMKGFDVIFCRNVTIYFEKDLQEMLYQGFYDGLNKDGYFIMGKTETLIGPAKDLFKPYNAKERIYAK
jgi:chemotaxis protein methyltransferase CheR